MAEFFTEDEIRQLKNSYVLSSGRARDADVENSVPLERIAGNMPFQDWCIPRVKRVVLIISVCKLMK